MEKIIFSFGNKNKKATPKKKEKVVLKHYPKNKGRKEYYTYINDNGEEEVIDVSNYHVIKKSASLTVAAKTIVDKINLDFVEGKESSPYKEEGFTYNGKPFTGKVEYDESDDSFYGLISKIYSFEEKVKIYKED